MEAKLALRWSPQQIAGWLRRAYPDDGEMRVSHLVMAAPPGEENYHLLRQVPGLLDGRLLQLCAGRRFGDREMERETRFELATSCLEGRRSTAELLPLVRSGPGVGRPQPPGAYDQLRF